MSQLNNMKKNDAEQEEILAKNIDEKDAQLKEQGEQLLML